MTEREFYSTSVLFNVTTDQFADLWGMKHFRFFFVWHKSLVFFLGDFRAGWKIRSQFFVPLNRGFYTPDVTITINDVKIYSHPPLYVTFKQFLLHGKTRIHVGVEAGVLNIMNTNFEAVDIKCFDVSSNDLRQVMFYL